MTRDSGLHFWAILQLACIENPTGI